jgi:uncharacterized protein (DUF1697 family)
MPSYVAFLRAVNVGKRQVRMADLRDWLVEDGFDDVETYIQTGNLRVASPTRSPAKIESRLEELIADRCGFDVPCIVLTPSELTAVYADAQALTPPFADEPDQRRFAVFFKQPVEADVVAAMADYDPPTERIWAIGRVAHVWITGNFHEAKVFTAFKKALAEGTNRNLDVVATLAGKWGA